MEIGDDGEENEVFPQSRVTRFAEKLILVVLFISCFLVFSLWRERAFKEG